MIGFRARISNARVYYDDFEFSAGGLQPGGEAVHGNPPKTPMTATVQWKTQDGVLHTEKIHVGATTVPRRFKGKVVFEINETNVVVLLKSE